MRIAAIASLLACAVACADGDQRAASPPVKPVPPETHAPVETDRDRYRLEEGPFGPETVIVTTFQAPPDQAAHLLNCNGALSLGLQRQEGEKWVNAWVAEINGCFSSPIVIPPGVRRTERMTVISRADAAIESRRTELRIGAGTYRAVWHGVVSSYDHDTRSVGPELPLEQRVSDPFIIEGGPPASAPK